MGKWLLDFSFWTNSTLWNGVKQAKKHTLLCATGEARGCSRERLPRLVKLKEGLVFFTWDEEACNHTTTIGGGNEILRIIVIWNGYRYTCTGSLWKPLVGVRNCAKPSCFPWSASFLSKETLVGVRNWVKLSSSPPGCAPFFFETGSLGLGSQFLSPLPIFLG